MKRHESFARFLAGSDTSDPCRLALASVAVAIVVAVVARPTQVGADSVPSREVSELIATAREEVANGDFSAAERAYSRAVELLKRDEGSTPAVLAAIDFARQASRVAGSLARGNAVNLAALADLQERFDNLAADPSVSPEDLLGASLTLAGIFLQSGDERGLEMLERSRGIARERLGPEVRQALDAQIFLELVKAGVHGRAEPIARELAAKSIESQPDAEWLPTLYWYLAERSIVRGDPHAALSQLRLATDAVERLAEEGLASKETAGIVEKHVVGVQLALPSSDREGAAVAAELAVRLASAEGAIEESALRSSIAGSGHRQQLEELVGERLALDDEVRACGLEKRLCEGKIKQLSERVQQLATEIASMAEGASGGAHAVGSERARISWTELRQHIPRDSRLVLFESASPLRASGNDIALDEPHFAAFVVGPPGEEISWVDLGVRAPNDPLGRELRAAISSQRADVDGVIASVSDAFLTPLAPLIRNAPNLIVIGLDDLEELPFDVLRTETGGPLIESHDVTYLRSPADLVNGRVAREWSGSSASERFIVVGAVANLKGAADEIDTVSTIVPGAEILKGPAASTAAVRALRSPQLLHFVAHGVYRGDPPPLPPASVLDDAQKMPNSVEELEQSRRRTLEELAVQLHTLGAWFESRSLVPMALSGIELDAAGGSNSGSGVLTALQVSELDLSGTDLVVVSSCSSGRQIPSPDGYAGLRTALQIAGSGTQILSLWDVDDDATSALMGEFYRRLLAGEGAGESLRAAKLFVREKPQWSAPFFWASFVLSGSSQPVDLRSDRGGAGRSAIVLVSLGLSAVFIWSYGRLRREGKP